MNPKQLVRLSNTIGIIAILLLIYWVFTFITIQVFGLKVFRENLTETFYMSILGILALMAGALIINVMFNLTRIAQKHNQDTKTATATTNYTWMLLASFPIIAILLFGGDYLTSQKKEKLLVQSAKSILETSDKEAEHLLNYEFNKVWVTQTSEILEILSKTDSNFPNVAILTRDSINGRLVVLGFHAYHSHQAITKDTIPIQKRQYIQSTTPAERNYLQQVFEEGHTEYRYSSYNGQYELFYPYRKGHKQVVIYFSEYRRYGKIGS